MVTLDTAERPRRTVRAGRGPSPRALRKTFRKLGADERWRMRDHLLRLSPADRSLRFCSTVSAAHIEEYCARVDDHHRIVVGYFADGELRGAGEIVFLSSPTWQGSCEIALSVEGQYQNRGVGAELLRRLLVIARNRGAASVRLLCVRENRKMQRLARKHSAELRFAGSDVEGVLYPRWPDTISLFEESWADGCALLDVVFGIGTARPGLASIDE